MHKENLSILVVDDQKSVVCKVVEHLSETNYNILTASNGIEVFDILHSKSVDLLLLDVMMPMMDGYEICRRIKNDIKYKDLPIVFLTGNRDIESLTKAFAAGGIDFMTKPFSHQELIVRVNTHLELRRKKRIIEEQNNELNKLNLLKNKLLSILAQDMENPFKEILVQLDALLDKISSGDDNLPLHQLLKKSHNGRNLLENLLLWSAIQRGSIQFSPQILNAYNEVEEVIFPHLLLAEQKGIFIHNYVNQSMDFNGDHQLVQAILRNVIYNAIKYTPDNGMVIIHANNYPNGFMMVIEDSGAGMSKTVMDRLFRFDNLAFNGSQPESGAGLGLYLSRECMKFHNGDLKIKSSPIEGTKVLLHFPK